MASFTLRLCQSSSLSMTVVLVIDTLWPVLKQCSPIPVDLSKLVCCLNLTPRCRCGSPTYMLRIIVAGGRGRGLLLRMDKH